MKDVDTLSYSHFTTEDFAKLKQIDELIARTSKKYLPKSFVSSMNSSKKSKKNGRLKPTSHKVGLFFYDMGQRKCEN
ncbi:methyl-accepting chemotaxis protein [Anoxybacillus flavithermus TNO-09.006]|uniref:Methyl-accepting chemotaxis protein n=1 Tax=Anoxybacillus flavithermus TaxID=33934 RepID=A0A178TDW3_9BACL|nr:hypothetical protein [Anoxybacillus flavithermus]ELK21538.1 methyl-accepting chemotaxis protein [Anoxybacillus flavithermus TNO-09.006]MBE2953713.1 hypothetical protein [Anoxybacillus flavithermus]OAO78341.1 Methyl-accepting chemotaxis protein [Anoxybacillus flavithermus]OAO79038.1 Methyl-accepting chemotaxis protein [Anoxybacillus flavithermus]